MVVMSQGMAYGWQMWKQRQQDGMTYGIEWGMMQDATRLMMWQQKQQGRDQDWEKQQRVRSKHVKAQKTLSSPGGMVWDASPAYSILGRWWYVVMYLLHVTCILQCMWLHLGGGIPYSTSHSLWMDHDWKWPHTNWSLYGNSIVYNTSMVGCCKCPFMEIVNSSNWIANTVLWLIWLVECNGNNHHRADSWLCCSWTTLFKRLSWMILPRCDQCHCDHACVFGGHWRRLQVGACWLLHETYLTFIDFYLLTLGFFSLTWLLNQWQVDCQGFLSD